MPETIDTQPAPRSPTRNERGQAEDLQADELAKSDTGRLEAFSDGVFSIALTLLVLELKVPKLATPTPAALWLELGRQWPSYFAFVTSFAAVLIMWVNHHGIFRLIRRADSVLLFTNGFLLLLVTAVPWPTALVAAFLRTPAASTACAVYCGLFVVISLGYAALLCAALRGGGGLLAPGARPMVMRRLRDCYRVGFPFYAIATAVAPFRPGLSMVIVTALWVFWSIGSANRGRAFGG